MANPRYQKKSSPVKDAGDSTSSESDQPKYDHMPGELIDLEPEHKKKLKELCKKAIEHWNESTTEHMEDLRRWNDMVEMVTEATDWPWVDASNVTMGLAAIHLNSLHSVICRSLLTVSPLWFGRPSSSQAKNPDIRERIPDVEDMLDDTAKSEANTLGATRMAIFCAGRDGISYTKTYWKEKREMICDVAICETPEDFQTQFPTPESCGMSKEEYEAKIQEVAGKLKELPPGEVVEIPIECESITYRADWTDVIEDANWVQAPATASEIEDCWAYGHLYDENRSNLKKRVENGECYEDVVEKFLEDGASSEKSDWKKANHALEGVIGKSSNNKWDFPLHELVVRYDMDGDGQDEKYVCQYSKEKNVLLGVVRYYWPMEIYEPWRFLRKKGRRTGISIPGAIEGLSNKVDDTFNRDENSADIDSVPVFSTTTAAKKTLDDGGFDDGSFFKPGGLIATENGSKDFQAIKIPTTDKATSQKRRSELIGYAEMILGPTAMISGKQSPIDPNAPGNKTIALIQQSNMRIEDYINELRISFDKLGEIRLMLYRRQGPNELSFRGRDGSVGDMKALKRTALSGIKLSTHGVTPMENPWIELQKVMMVMNVLGKDPMVASDPLRKRELLEMFCVAARLQNRESLLPSKEEIQGIVDKAKEDAMRQKVVQSLMSSGIIPGLGFQPMPETAGPMGALPPAKAPGLPPGMPIPGAGAGAAGLPPQNDLPPMGGM
jgi:hypothetical protein